MKAKSLHGVQPKKVSQMSDEGFADLKEALEGALAFERAERRDLHVTRIRAPHPQKKKSPKDSANVER